MLKKKIGVKRFFDTKLPLGILEEFKPFDQKYLGKNCLINN